MSARKQKTRVENATTNTVVTLKNNNHRKMATGMTRKRGYLDRLNLDLDGNINMAFISYLDITWNTSSSFA